ncbi:MAG: glycoside hydrolase family 3 C-terminal domain-containing protein [Phototrophicaceae bacterium]
MNNQIAEMLHQMTLEEKAALCTGATTWRTLAVERLGLKPIVVSDGPHGVRRLIDIEDVDNIIGESHPATCFPVAAALAATWNTDLLYEMGQALADESIALDVDIVLGPGINIKRSPLCGRNFEYYAEDPLLAGELAAALINGVQSKGVGTSLKHFAVNNQETRRFTVDAVVDERTLHEIYLTGFEIAIRKARPWTVMCAYNSVNGDYCAHNPYLLTDILRDQWQYEGFVMSDWGAVHDRVKSLQAGLELEMPGPSPHRTQAVVRAVENGELPIDVLDRAVERLLRVIFRAQETPKGHTTFDVDRHHELARRIAGEALVLLKNASQTLPLTGGERLAVIGQAAVTPVYQGGGSSHINATRVDNALDLLKQRAQVQYTAGDKSFEVDTAAIEAATKLAADADVALLFMALPASVESEGYDRDDLNLTPQQIALIQAVGRANARTVVILNNGSAIDMRAWIDDVAAVVEAWLPGQAGAGAVVDVLYGDVNPSGKLAETFPLRLNDIPAQLNFPGDHDTVRYGEGLFVGYRAFDEMQRDVLFPFGFGLSYTQFEYSDLRVSATELRAGESLEVTVSVTNTGPVAGQEIVQLYVHDHEARLRRPYKELKAFAKVSLEPGQTRQVTLALDERAFSYYDPAHSRWVAEAGTFDILVGSSSADIRLRQQVTLTEGTPLPSIISIDSTLSDWMTDPRGMAVLGPVLEQMFGTQSASALGVDMIRFFQHLPLTVLLGFTGHNADHSPEEIAAELVAKVHQAQ